MKYYALIFFMLLISACTVSTPNQVTQIMQVQITATLVPTRTPSNTPTPSHTPTPTSTPTPTAPPVSISGNPQGLKVSDPVPAKGAYCGLIDTLDFPLNPPDAEDISGGNDFGTYRSRYDKYHAGEDWGLRNESNFGKPVYSIGHGFVTYAAPNGWGLDRGVIVIRHILSNGESFLSFYGHLDPPSVTLSAGECVSRGEKIGEIGRPRTPPHLHFEIRTHLPNSAGTGYWPTDPTEAGWLPPSQTISEMRLAAYPGILWTQTHAKGLIRPMGMQGDEFIFIHDSLLKSVDPTQGTIQWSQPISDTIRNAVIDIHLPQVYFFDLLGRVTASPLNETSGPNWRVDLKSQSSADLISFPEGGVIVADRQHAILLGSDGNILWKADTFASIISWSHIEKGLIFTTSDTENPMWQATEEGAAPWDWGINGKLVTAGETVYLYSEDGLYRLDIEKQTGVKVVPLPRGKPNLGNIIPLSDGGLLLFHVDSNDRRLIALNPDLTLRWERSIKGFTLGELKLAIQGELGYLLWSHSTSGGNQVNLYAINLESAELIHILVGGTRVSYSRQNWLVPVGENLLFVNIGMGPLGMFDPLEALNIVTAQNNP